jgi:hypothetical protein
MGTGYVLSCTEFEKEEAIGVGASFSSSVLLGYSQIFVINSLPLKSD